MATRKHSSKRKAELRGPNGKMRSPAALVLTDKIVECARVALKRIDDAVGMLDIVDRLLIMSIGISKNKDQAAMLEAALIVLTKIREQASACSFDSGEPCLNSSIATVSYAIRNAVAVDKNPRTLGRVTRTAGSGDGATVGAPS